MTCSDICDSAIDPLGLKWPQIDLWIVQNGDDEVRWMHWSRILFIIHFDHYLHIVKRLHFNHGWTLSLALAWVRGSSGGRGGRGTMSRTRMGSHGRGRCWRRAEINEGPADSIHHTGLISNKKLPQKNLPICPFSSRDGPASYARSLSSANPCLTHHPSQQTRCSSYGFE